MTIIHYASEYVADILSNNDLTSKEQRFLCQGKLYSLIFQGEIDLNDLGTDGHTHLTKAVELNDIVTTKYLLTCKEIQINQPINNKPNFAAIHIAIKNNNHSMVKLLIKKGANLNRYTVEFPHKVEVPCTISEAMQVGDVKICKTLVMSGAIVESWHFRLLKRLMNDYRDRRQDATCLKKIKKKIITLCQDNTYAGVIANQQLLSKHNLTKPNNTLRSLSQDVISANIVPFLLFNSKITDKVARISSTVDECKHTNNLP
jgi:hypothetical protein